MKLQKERLLNGIVQGLSYTQYIGYIIIAIVIILQVPFLLSVIWGTIKHLLASQLAWSCLGGIVIGYSIGCLDERRRLTDEQTVREIRSREFRTRAHYFVDGDGITWERSDSMAAPSRIEPTSVPNGPLDVTQLSDAELREHLLNQGIDINTRAGKNRLAAMSKAQAQEAAAPAVKPFAQPAVVKPFAQPAVVKPFAQPYIGKPFAQPAAAPEAPREPVDISQLSDAQLQEHLRNRGIDVNTRAGQRTLKAYSMAREPAPPTAMPDRAAPSVDTAPATVAPTEAVPQPPALIPPETNVADTAGAATPQTADIKE